MTKKQIGGYQFNQECNRIERAASTLRDDLSELIKNPGPQTLTMLGIKMAVQVMIIIDAIHKIEDIGEDARDERT